MQLFYAPDLTTPLYTLGEEESKHCIRVLRLRRGDTLHLTDGRGTQIVECGGMKFKFFGNLILDVLNGTERAMTQAHAFKAIELALKSQAFAEEKNNG